jgi:hypothetical protein
MKDSRQIISDELKTESFICKHNTKLLQANSLHLQLKFLKSLVTKAKTKGDITCASKVTGIIQKETSRKRWRQINWSTCKARGSLMVAVKVPIANESHNEYKTKEGVFEPVTPILLERSQSALVAQCHQETFFEDAGHLADKPMAQQILDGTYVYPPDLDPATRLLFEEALATYATLSPTTIETYVTPKDFQHFWQNAREQMGSSYSGLHFSHYILASYCPDLLLLQAAKLSICARNGVPLAQWGKGLTVLLEKIMGNVFFSQITSYLSSGGRF